MAMKDHEDIVQLQRIGSGGEGDVISGIYRGQPVAIKKYERTNANELTARKEVSVMMLAQKEFHMISFVGYAYAGNEICVIMDFAYNYSLSYLLSRARNYLSLQLKQRLAYDICCSLKCLHDLDISHEDLKPDNIILDFGLRAKICDFGHCKHISDTYDKFSGTKGYRSPEKEQFIESGAGTKYDRIKSDIYSVGIIIKEIYGDDTGSSCMSPEASQRPSCYDLIEMFKPSRVDYTNFRGVEKYLLSEVDSINIAYNWSYDSCTQDCPIDKCRPLFATRQYTEAYNLLLNTDDHYLKHFFMGILLFHGMGCEKDSVESLVHLLKCKDYLKDEEMLESQMAFLVEYYISIQISDEDKMLTSLLLLSDKGNSFARVELMDLYSSTEFLLKHLVSPVVRDRFIIGASRSGHSHAQALYGIYGFSLINGEKGMHTPESIRFLKRSVEGGSVLGQLILDVVQDKVDFNAIRNPYAADFIGDMYFLAANYDMAELWYHRSRSLYGLALVYRSREPSLAMTIASALTMDNSPLVEGYSLKLNKRLMLQAHYYLASVNVAHGRFEVARSYLMSCTDETVYALEFLGMFFRTWMERVGDYSAIEQKRSSMSREAIYRFANYLRERKELDKAVEWALIGADMGDCDCMHLLALEYYKDGRMDEAETWASRGILLGNQACRIVRAVEGAKKSNDKSCAIPVLQECGHTGEAKYILGMLHNGAFRERYLLESSSLGFHYSYLELAKYYESVKSYHKVKHWYCTHFYYFVKEQQFEVHVPYEDVMLVITNIVNSGTLNVAEGHLMRICVIEEKRALKEQYEWMDTDDNRYSMIIMLARNKLAEENPSILTALEPIVPIPEDQWQKFSL